MIAARRNHSSWQPPEVRREVGAALRVAREAARLSQRDVAARLGITPAMTCSMERGQRRVPLERMRDVASVYGVPQEHLERPPSVTRNADEVALLHAFRHLSEDERAKLLAMVRS
ncbi:helix-turn-helix domain-containing protein [Methylobacterium sp. NMS14P]|uniref:helix-turn-helix domain-containing protein n=1 Tax=Methylobacterium sp. NMS14P TaxID=2894310 RepID=UPI00235895D1|nr:helix-turn-helix transcriptional regulator [Methylobacterium sp. NMS14P]WCS27822.1 helix-turn-helix domain-containing protein [Methylobacterium sp. NMS14P]